MGAETLPGALPRTDAGIIVRMADLQVSDDPEATLVTYALGSCLGVTVWDGVALVGGMLHVMLPSSGLDPGRARENPERFVDTGIPLLFRSCYALGARKERMVTKVVGGASMVAEGASDRFQTGKRNYLALKQILWRNGVMLEAEDVGGRVSRTLSLHVGSGTVSVKTPTESRFL
jgi:chemotaxis protein CheD